MKKLIIALVCLGQFGFSHSQTVTLDQCQEWSKENYPVLRQKDMLQEISGLNQENLKTNYFPQVSLNGQVTYQSDVTQVEIPMPNINIPEVSKGQYKVYLDIKQSIWDAGMTKASQDLESVANEIGLQQVEVELYALKQQVNEVYFINLLLKENIHQLEETMKVLYSRLKVLESGFENGVIEENNLDQLKAEILMIKQKLIELESGWNSSIMILNLYTGKNFDPLTKFEKPEVIPSQKESFSRPEFTLMEQNKSRLDKMYLLKKKTRLPQVFGFGQAGYGKPALNMLSDEFDPYYLVGVGIKWNVLDWNKTKREQKIIGLRKQIVDTQKQELEFKLQMMLDRQLMELIKLEDLIISDQELVELRSKISNRSASKLENGTITSADYLQDVNAETTSRINLETRKLKLLEAIINHNTIKGL